MPTMPRCRAQYPALCTSPQCPLRRAGGSHPEPTAADYEAHAAAMVGPTPYVSGTGAGHAPTAEGNYTRRNGARIAAEMVACGTQDSYMHDIMAAATTKPTYRLLVVRDALGPSGYIEYHIERTRGFSPDLVIHNVRTRQTQQGAGADRNSKGAGGALMRYAAQLVLAEAHPDTTLTVQGAVASAKPFYAKMGGRTREDLSLVRFSRAAVEALAAGQPIAQPHPYTG